jgi:hypothetical protein
MSNERLQLGYLEIKNRPMVNGTGVLLSGEATAGGTTFFNGSRQIKRTTWPSLQTVGGNTVTEFLENVFFPYTNTTVTINDFQIRTYGVDSIASSLFAGNINKQDDIITGIAYRSSSNILAGPFSRADVGGNFTTAPQLISLNQTLTSSSNEIYNVQLYLVNPQGQSITTNSISKRIRFEPRYYYGLSSNPSLGSPGITSLTSSSPSNYTYSFESRPPSVTHSFAPTGQYIYFAYPSPSTTQDNIINWGNSLSSIFDINANFEYLSSFQNVGTTDINFTFKSLRYRIYRSNNLLTVGANQNFNLRFTFGG